MRHGDTPYPQENNFFRARNPHQRTTQNINQNLRQSQIVDVAVTPEANDRNNPESDVLDHYDNFYHTTKSLLVLFQIMGVMPIERNPKGNLQRTSFKYALDYT